ncbi:MAG: M23 family metallopeptidase [Proteobacteria bacterium]|nr:M23 family metallopeptidase [Pseudomonadota bacterium]MBU1709646.1 M23 family metallopeptidase [Pseudomonadota bacterium]
MSLQSSPSKRIKAGSNFLQILLIVGLIVLGVAGFLLVKLYERERPQVTLLTDITRIGISREVSIVVTDAKSGISEMEITMKQGANKTKLYGKKFPKHSLFFNAGPHRIEEVVMIAPRELGFDDGRAEIIIEVKDHSWSGWMEGNTASVSYSTMIDTQPPAVSVIYSSRYIKPGGSGVVVYKVNEAVIGHGVTINDIFYPGFQLENRVEGMFVSYIGIPFNTEKIETAMVSAADNAGNEGKSVFGVILRKVVYEKDRINLSDAFFKQKLPEFSQYYPEMSGTDVEQYLYVNNTVRQDNAGKITEICRKSVAEKHWKGTFKRLPRSSRRAGFAEFRSYYYQDENIDQQYHLGIDLASVRHATVTAANDGLVVFADYMGIYGNTVILDHGQGIFSLYSHLSQVSAQVGDSYEKGATLGLTGTTGMAGGDHLHFAMLINGVFVNPIEWWDASWLNLNIESHL